MIHELLPPFLLSLVFLGMALKNRRLIVVAHKNTWTSAGGGTLKMGRLNVLGQDCI